MFTFVNVLYAVLSLNSGAWSKLHHENVVRLQGDIMIGGLFAIHEEITGLQNYSEGHELACTRFQIRGFLRSLAMIHSIERINSFNLLPGITLGYEIYDTCSDAGKALQDTIKLIRKWWPNEENLSGNCNSTYAMSPVKVVIGADYSEVSLAIARLLSFQLIPQISYGSSDEILSDKHRFPSFLRTIPSNVHLSKALAMLMSKFNWNYIGIIVSDDSYGCSFNENLSAHLNLENICVAFLEKIPTDFEYSSFYAKLKNVVSKIKESPAKVIVLAMKVTMVVELFKEIVRHNITRVWIANDKWSNSREVSEMKDIERVGCIIGYSYNYGIIPGFRRYLLNLHSDKKLENPFVEEYIKLRFSCNGDFKNDNQCLQESEYLANIPSDDYLVKNLDLDGSYGVYLAVNVIKEALANLLCSKGVCIHNTSFSPGKLLQELKKVDFWDNKEHVRFDDFGNVNNGFYLLSWQKRNGSMQFIVAGKYALDKGSLTLNDYDIFWNTLNNEVPRAKCSISCIPGEYKIQSKITCCYNCSFCPEGYYSDRLDMNQCIMCPLEQWSPRGSPYCLNRTILYLDWKDPFAAILTSFVGLGFALVLTISVIFLVHLSTPAVKAAGGVYTCIMNLSLLSSFISSILFVGEPSDCACKISQPLYGISFTICISCILIKSFRVVLAFELGQRSYYHFKYRYQPVFVIIILGGIQTVLCISWLVLQPPSVKKIAIGQKALIIQCDEGSTLLFGIMLAYNGFLAFVCFVLAYQERKLPEIYNDGRFITFSMLIYIFVWFAFIPVHVTTTGKYLPAVEMMAILASSFGVICCHLLPACYKIFFKRHSNKRHIYLQNIQYKQKNKLSAEGIPAYHSKKSQTCMPSEHINTQSSGIPRKRSKSM